MVSSCFKRLKQTFKKLLRCSRNWADSVRIIISMTLPRPNARKVAAFDQGDSQRLTNMFRRCFKKHESYQHLHQGQYELRFNCLQSAQARASPAGPPPTIAMSTDSKLPCVEKYLSLGNALLQEFIIRVKSYPPTKRNVALSISSGGSKYGSDQSDLENLALGSLPTTTERFWNLNLRLKDELGGREINILVLLRHSRCTYIACIGRFGFFSSDSHPGEGHSSCVGGQRYPSKSENGKWKNGSVLHAYYSKDCKFKISTFIVFFLFFHCYSRRDEVNSGTWSRKLNTTNKSVDIGSHPRVSRASHWSSEVASEVLWEWDYRCQCCVWGYLAITKVRCHFLLLASSCTLSDWFMKHFLNSILLSDQPDIVVATPTRALAVLQSEVPFLDYFIKHWLHFKIYRYCHWLR